MIQDHPRGAGPLVGRQLRYLTESERGWLGGLSFSSSALNLEARDQWIGWDWSSRQDNLHYLVNMSRFLIRSGISCKNLASCVPGMCIRQFPDDYEPRLCTSNETFNVLKSLSAIFEILTFHETVNIDLLKYFDFYVDEAKQEALRLHPGLRVLQVGAPVGLGMDDWITYLQELLAR